MSEYLRKFKRNTYNRERVAIRASYFADSSKIRNSVVPLDFFRNVACKRTSTSPVSCPFSCVLGTDTCPVGTKGAVIQTDEYSRVALRCNESFEFIRTVARGLFFATIASYVSTRDLYVFARNSRLLA